MAPAGVDEGRSAERNGVTLRKVFAGIEVVELTGDGGAEFVSAGFQKGDVITKVDNISALGDETSCAQLFQTIAASADDVGRAYVEGFRRVAAFPRPTRTTV